MSSTDSKYLGAEKGKLYPLLTFKPLKYTKLAITSEPPSHSSSTPEHFITGVIIFFLHDNHYHNPTTYLTSISALPMGRPPVPGSLPLPLSL